MERQQLIDLCERAIVDVSKWRDRDSPAAQINVATCRALLKANCLFEIITEGSLTSDKRTTWIKIWYPDFSNMEDGISVDDKELLYYDNFYLPTEERLARSINSDWY